MDVPALAGEGALQPEQEVSPPGAARAQGFTNVVVVARVTELEHALTHYLHLK